MTAARATFEVFISASIPNVERWSEAYDAYEITDAVVAFTRALLTAGATIVTAAHPTIAPLILTVARELPELAGERDRVLLYQSELFRGQLPDATLKLVEEQFVTLEWTPRHPDDEPIHPRWNRSLETMRREMFARPIEGAVFVGGMDGILAEHEMLASARPEAALYPVHAPGGAATRLPAPGPLRDELSASQLYPYLADLVVGDLEDRRPATG